MLSARRVPQNRTGLQEQKNAPAQRCVTNGGITNDGGLHERYTKDKRALETKTSRRGAHESLDGYCDYYCRPLPLTVGILHLPDRRYSMKPLKHCAFCRRSLERDDTYLSGKIAGRAYWFCDARCFNHWRARPQQQEINLFRRWT